jgi:hypothetical protein
MKTLYSFVLAFYHSGGICALPSLYTDMRVRLALNKTIAVTIAA